MTQRTSTTPQEEEEQLKTQQMKEKPDNQEEAKQDDLQAKRRPLKAHQLQRRSNRKHRKCCQSISIAEAAQHKVNNFRSIPIAEEGYPIR